jgi:hypothetical protein
VSGRLLLLLAACWLAACAAGGERVTPDQLPAAALGAPERFIVVAVADQRRALPARAGSTPRAYGGTDGYVAGAGARAEIARLAGDYGIRRIAAWPIATLSLYCVVFELPATASADALIEKLSADQRVKLAQPLQTFHTSSAAYNDPYIGLQRGFAAVDAAGAQRWSRGAGVRVAVIDTGVDLDHPDLRGRVQLARDFVDDDAARFSRDRHGTEVAGLIAAQANNHVGIVGIAPEAEILSLKACWETVPGTDSATCNSFTLAKALAAALELHADVVNLSLVGPNDALLTLLVKEGLHQGIVFVGAVPPSGEMTGFPVSVAGVLAVDRAELVRPANGSLRAPGADILTLTADGRYDFVSGSSVAAAQVSGVVALLLSRNRQLTPQAIRELLSQPAVAAETADATVNACEAMAALLHEPRCPGEVAAGTEPGASAPITPIAAEMTRPH